MRYSTPGVLLTVEIKSSATVTDELFKGLRNMQALGDEHGFRL